MNRQHIEKIIALHIATREDFISLLKTDDRSPLTQDFMDGACETRRMRILGDLMKVSTAPAEEFHAAFETFGIFETKFFLADVAGSPELLPMRNLYMAAYKLGQPEESWEKIRETTESMSSLELKNPQAVASGDFSKKIESAVEAFVAGSGSVDDIPYFEDRIFLNSLQGCSSTISCAYDTGNCLRVVGILLDRVVRIHDTNQTLTVEQELRCAGLLTLAGTCAGSAFDWVMDLNDKPLSEHIETMQRQCLSLAERHSQYPDLQEDYKAWGDRFGTIADTVAARAAAGCEVFDRPAAFAVRIYNADLMHKLERILKVGEPARKSAITGNSSAVRLGL